MDGELRLKNLRHKYKYNVRFHLYDRLARDTTVSWYVYVNRIFIRFEKVLTPS